MRPIDALLLERASQSGRAHVVVIPSAAIPDGPQVVERWASMGRAHFTALGATVDVIAIGAGADAADSQVAARIAAASLVYVSGGKPGFLLDTLRGTIAWDAVLGVYARNGVIVGCSAGAMVLGAALVAPRLQRPLATRPAFGLVPNSLILPHYDALPTLLRGLAMRFLPRTLTVIGIDEETALIQDGAIWQVHGRSGVELRRAGTRTRYRSGATLLL
jgi:cyanophycinase